MHQGVGIAPK
jgi:hypothetical protein